MFSGPVSAPVTAEPHTNREEEEEEKRLKRKREDAENTSDEIEERGEIKKVCKEGFQLFHHNVCLLLFLSPKNHTLKTHRDEAHVFSCRERWLDSLSHCVCVFFRSSCVKGLCGGEAWRAGGDAGCSCVAIGYDQLFVSTAQPSVSLSAFCSTTTENLTYKG